MIYDRTAVDVDLAGQIREKLQKGLNISEAEIVQLERGTYTVNSLNRVENKQDELKNRLINYSYYLTILNKNWSVSQTFNQAEHKRVLDNLDKIKQSFCIYVNTPATPKYIYGYDEANAIEKILVDIEKMLNNMPLYFKICGDYECGG